MQVAEGARLRGAAKIIGVDLNPDKFEIGKLEGRQNQTSSSLSCIKVKQKEINFYFVVD